MPLRLLMPIGIIWGSFKSCEWIYDRLRWRWHNYHHNTNTQYSKQLGTDSVDKPAPRKINFEDYHQNIADIILYQKYLKIGRKEWIAKYTEDNSEWAKKDKIAVSNDIILKEKILKGIREKGERDYSEFFEWPWYYKNWRKKTDPIFDQEARDLAARKPLVYGVPYWNGIKSSDLD